MDPKHGEGNGPLKRPWFPILLTGGKDKRLIQMQMVCVWVTA